MAIPLCVGPIRTAPMKLFVILLLQNWTILSRCSGRLWQENEATPSRPKARNSRARRLRFKEGIVGRLSEVRARFVVRFCTSAPSPSLPVTSRRRVQAASFKYEPPSAPIASDRGAGDLLQCVFFSRSGFRFAAKCSTPPERRRPRAGGSLWSPHAAFRAWLRFHSRVRRVRPRPPPTFRPPAASCR